MLNFGDGPKVDSTPTIQPLPKGAADPFTNSPSQMTVNECDDNEPLLKDLPEAFQNLKKSKGGNLSDVWPPTLSCNLTSYKILFKSPIKEYWSVQNGEEVTESDSSEDECGIDTSEFDQFEPVYYPYNEEIYS